MGHSPDAPAGHRLPHAVTMPTFRTGSPSTGSASPTLDAKTHKHFQSHSHTHVATPYPVLEHSSSIESDGSTGSTDYMQSHSHHRHHIHRPSVPNPVHMVQDHVSEFKYGHTARSAKREARKSSSSPHPWNLDASLARHNSIPEEQYEEVVEDWKERDEQAWAEELRKREAARRSYAGFVASTATETTN